ncbi:MULTISPECIES: type II toxin-antitoxin system MqsR family toxin [unclassified Fibrobacter]|uniref:type II toxin-antitoxin system MqsR family toxin n=1 Tax=unclassified Fibrobacter TaxID=2634177 RepID=UPI000D6C67A2|nr:MULTISPECIES: type II toxin-antitoxin system MqsR family toxin [unclassified Fibrobacter]PWJ68183.1 motility quorum-sensing regulator/GCU-specific mRNA interferase toxin [Fibrobacter sp. UWR4]PZW72541.1 motility quorum-sensing regulator/GCU-specific mRNA interferase toxin [Fibrobacter sp. UWR1]
MEHLGKAHYDLELIKKLLQDKDKRFVTRSSKQTAVLLGYTDEDSIVERVCKLRSNEIYKTMTTDADTTLWQDVYHSADTKADGSCVRLYIKIQITKNGNGVVISFKEL